MGDLDASLVLIQQSLKIDPAQPFTEYNKGKALQTLNKPNEAIASFGCEAIDSFNRAVALNPENAIALSNRGCSFKALGNLKGALADLDRAAKLQPAVPEIQKNRGDILRELIQYESAIKCYDLAIQNRPNYAEAYNNKGLALKELHRLDEALENDDQVIALKINYPEINLNRGWILDRQRKYREALKSYERAISEQPDIDYGLGNVLAMKMRIFDWQGLDEMASEVIDRIAKNQRSTTPFSGLTFSDSLDIQRKAAKIWLADRHPISKENKPSQPWSSGLLPVSKTPCQGGDVPPESRTFSRSSDGCFWACPEWRRRRLDDRRSSIP